MAGSLSPLSGEEGLGHPTGAGRGAGQAASGGSGERAGAAAPEATAGSQLVSWTTME